VVVDLRIPGVSGEEMGGLTIIAESLKSDPLRPVIVITGFGSVELARQTLKEGIFDFIEKSERAVGVLVESVQKAVDYRNEKIVRAGNPFTPMTGVDPCVFGGRTKELEFLEQRLNRALQTKYCEHFLVLGCWGIGKSTLLREFKKIFQSRGHLACVVPLEPLQSDTSLIGAARSIVEGILRDLPYPIDRFKKLTELFGSIGINILGTGLQFSRYTAKKDLSAQAFLHDALSSLWKDLEDKTGAILILLDDLDNFAAVPEIVRTLQQTLSMDSIRKTKILVGLASPTSSWMTLTAMERHHPLTRFFLPRVELGPLSEGELQETIIKSLAGTGVSFSSLVLAKVFEYTKGHPFEMQVLCHHLFSHQLSRKVEVDVWDKALQAALHDIGVAMFYHWIRQASVEEAKVLRLVADAEGSVSSKEIQGRAKSENVKISLANITKYLQRLAEKQIIQRTERGLYTVEDRMFRAFIRSHSL
jgi:CheY-like chemotaxis protein